MNTRPWPERRKNLRILVKHSTQSSSLRQKKTIINRLKSLGSENLQNLLEELELENFSMFHIEIVTNLLSNPPVASANDKTSLIPILGIFSCIHKIVEIAFFFSFDTFFFGHLLHTLKKSCTKNWAFSCILLETFLLGSKLKKTHNATLEEAALTLLRGLGYGKVPFILYAISFFDIDKSVFIPFMQCEIKKIDENNFQLIKHTMDALGIRENLPSPKSYVDVIKPLPGEFSFYEECKAPENFIFPTVNTLLIKDIEKRRLEPYILDYIGYSIYEHPELIKKVIGKKKYVDFIPSIARILSKAIKNSQNNYCNSIINCLESDSDLILISECYKFGLFTIKELFDLINQLIEKNFISKLCAILENLGRFILYKKETNKQAIGMIEQLRQCSLDKLSRIRVSHCISMIINPEFCKIGAFEFIRWFLNSPGYEKTVLFEEMKNSSRFILMILSRPEIFNDEKFFTKFIDKIKNSALTDLALKDNNGMTNSNEEFIRNFYLSAIPKIYRSHKLLSQNYIQALTFLMKNTSQQASILDAFLKGAMDEGSKYKYLLLLLDAADPNLHKGYLEILRHKLTNDVEFQAMLFNFCEKYRYEYTFEDVESDSFEREICRMSEYD